MDSNKLRVWQVSEASASVSPVQRVVNCSTISQLTACTRITRWGSLQVVNLVDLKETFEGMTQKYAAGRVVWDVHNPDLLCFSLGSRLVGWDLRSNE